MSSNMPPAAKKIQLILDWTWYQKQKGCAISHKFNTEYVEFLYHVLDRDGRLSTADMKKLENIISWLPHASLAEEAILSTLGGKGSYSCVHTATG